MLRRAAVAVKNEAMPTRPKERSVSGDPTAAGKARKTESFPPKGYVRARRGPQAGGDQDPGVTTEGRRKLNRHIGSGADFDARRVQDSGRADHGGGGEQPGDARTPQDNF